MAFQNTEWPVHGQDRFIMLLQLHAIVKNEGRREQIEQELFLMAALTDDNAQGEE